MKKLILLISFIVFGITTQATVHVVDSLNDSGTGSLRSKVALAANGDTIRFNPSLIANGSDSIVFGTRVSLDKSLTLVGLYTVSDTLFLSGGGSNGVFWVWGSNSLLVLDSLVIINSAVNHGIEINDLDSLSISNSIMRNCAYGGLTFSKNKTSFSLDTTDFKVAMFMNNCLFKEVMGTNSLTVASTSDNNPASCVSKIWMTNSKFINNLGGGPTCFSWVSGSDVQTALTKAWVENCDFINNEFIGLGISSSSGSNPADSTSSSLVDADVIKSRFIGNTGNFGLFVSNPGYLNATVDLYISETLFEDNVTNAFGSIYAFGGHELNMFVERSQFNNNISSQGGGAISVDCNNPNGDGARVVSVQKSYFTNNHTGIKGGAIRVNFPNWAGNQMVDEVNINKCSFVNNITDSLTGGAICIESNGPAGYVCNLNVNRTSFINNHAKQNGGAISLKHLGWGFIQAGIKNSTFYKNSSPLINDIYSNSFGGNNQLKTESSIFYNTSGINTSFSDTFSLTHMSLGYNVFSGSSITGSVSSDQLNVDSTSLNLGALAYNGGFTPTMMPVVPSVAIDMGNPLDSSDAQNAHISGIRDVGAAEVCFATFATDTIEACNSYTWIDGVTYTANDTAATFTIANAAGCDSIITLNLTIKNNTFGIDTVTACNQYTWNGITYTANNNTALDTLVNVVGCDSIVTLNLTIHPTTFGTDSIVACHSYTWIDGNTFYSNNTTAKDTLTNQFGCDSVVSLNLTIHPQHQTTDVITACDSLTWINGVTYTSSINTAKDTLTNQFGCDSIVTLNLTITHTTFGTDVVSACDSYVWNGITYTSNNNTALDTLVNASGCDSIVTLDLTINQTVYATDVHVVCDSLVWINGNTYFINNNTATHTIVGGSVAGCDSIVTLDLTVNSNSSTFVISSCDSLTWIDGLTYYSSTNNPTQIFTNAAGCDSTVTLNLTILNSNTYIEVITACNSYTWNGVTYTSSTNTPQITLTNQAGCDSVVTLDLTINNTTYGTDEITACESYIWNGITYTSNNNTALDTLVNAAGCDSIVTLDLTILQSTTATDVISSCAPITWLDGNMYSASNNTTTHTTTNTAGCDSVITLDFTLLQPTTGTDVVTSCAEITWIDGNVYNATIIGPTFTIPNAAGCDSVVTLDFTLLEVDTAVVRNYLTLTAQSTNATYQWIDCDNGIMPNETNADFTATQNGDYQVEVTQNGCVDTSACFSITNVGIQQAQLLGVNVYPNPTSDVLHIDKGSNVSLEITVTNSAGSIVYNSSTENQITTIEMAKMASGVYVVTLRNELGVSVDRIVKR